MVCVLHCDCRVGMLWLMVEIASRVCVLRLWLNLICDCVVMCCDYVEVVVCEGVCNSVETESLPMSLLQLSVGTVFAPTVPLKY